MQEVQADLPPRLYAAVQRAGSAVAHHGLLDQRPGRVGTAAGLIPARRAGELLDAHPQDLRQAHQDAVTVDAALTSLDLGQPGLRPADQPGEHGLRQAAPTPGTRDPLPDSLTARRRKFQDRQEITLPARPSLHRHRVVAGYPSRSVPVKILSMTSAPVVMTGRSSCR